MDQLFGAFPFSIGLLAGMLICLKIGRRLGLRRLSKHPQGSMSGVIPLQGAVFALYGLLLAFTFSGAPERFDARRNLIVIEANAISTAWLRLDLLPAESQPALREQFRQYVDSRLEVYRKLPDIDAAAAAFSRGKKLQLEIWAAAVAATPLPGSHPDAAKLLLPALNEMIDVTTTRSMTAQLHPPLSIFALLFLLALVCSLLAGYGMAGDKERSWLHITAFVGITVLTVFVVLSIEYPRDSYIRVQYHSFDQILVEVRENMH
jgi:hypothetical protein